MGSGDGQRSVDRNDVKPKPDEPQEDDIKVWWRQECNEGAHFYIMGCLEPGSWNAVVLAWSGCVDDAATRWRRHSYIHSYIMGWVKVTR